MNEQQIFQLLQQLGDKYLKEGKLGDWLSKHTDYVSKALNVGKEWVIEHAQEIKDEIIKQYPKFKEELLEGISELHSEIKNVIKDATAPVEKAQNLKKVNCELLNNAKLMQLVKDNIVEGSNQAGVYLKRGKNCYYIYVCYLKDNNIIRNSENNQIIITAEGISRDIENYFKDSSLIILK